MIRRALFFALIVAGSCVRGRVPTTEMHRLLPLPAAEMPPGDNGLETGAVAVVEYVAPGIYGDSRIVYRVGESGYGAYPYREWAIPLGEALGRRTAEVLLRNPLTRDPAVYDPASRRGFAYVWRGTVREFEEVNRGSAVLVAVQLEGSLVRASDDSLVWAGTRRVERPVPKGTIENIIAELTTATDEVIAALITDARLSMRQRGASAERSDR